MSQPEQLEAKFTLIILQKVLYFLPLMVLNFGSEANENALKIMKQYWKERGQTKKK